MYQQIQQGIRNVENMGIKTAVNVSVALTGESEVTHHVDGYLASLIIVTGV